MRMGGGTRYGTDTPKGSPRDILVELAASGAPGFRDAAEFCTQVHTVEFEAVDGADVWPGQSVRLDAGVPPLLISSEAVVGRVPGQLGQALNGCLAMNFSLTGAVDRFDSITGFGSATLAGATQQAA